MLICCPECKVCYRIEEGVIPAEGRRFRCAKCSAVWQAMPEDLFPETPENSDSVYDADADDGNEVEDIIPVFVSDSPTETPQEEVVSAEEPPSAIDAKDLSINNDMQAIFSRLHQQAEIIEKIDKSMSPIKKIFNSIHDALGLHHKLNRFLVIFVILGLLLLAMFSFRFGIVRYCPWLEVIYGACGLQSKIIGEGLIFQNITRNEYEEDYVKKMQIKGFIVNATDSTITIPEISVVVLDRDINKLQDLSLPPPVKELAPNARTPFSVTITQPSPLSKHILLTFIKKKD